MKMVLSGEGVKVAPLASGATLTPSPLAEVWVAPSSFLCLGRRLILSECCLPEDGQASVDLCAYQHGIRQLIERLQALLLLLTENSGGQQTVIRRLDLIPLAPHRVAV